MGAGGFAAVASTTLALSEQRYQQPHWIHSTLPSREEQVRRLSQGTAANPYDVLIIGGGDAHCRRDRGDRARALPPPPPLPPFRPALRSLGPCLPY